MVRSSYSNFEKPTTIMISSTLKTFYAAISHLQLVTHPHPFDSQLYSVLPCAGDDALADSLSLQMQDSFKCK